MRALLTLLSLTSLPALAVGLNDTGIGFCGANNNNNAACTSVASDEGTAPRQDARYGRDAAAAVGKLTKVGGGEAGFDFTAIDASGQPTPPGLGASLHPCVRDNVTGLVWEVKTADGGLRDQTWTYTWYDSVHNYGGKAGTASGGICQTTGRCDTEKYVADVNAAGLCGFHDWRMPTRNDLLGIVHLGRTNPAIAPIYFPNTPNWYFWSGSPVIGNSSLAQFVTFDLGLTGADYRYNDNHVRLVRSGQ